VKVRLAAAMVAALALGACSNVPGAPVVATLGPTPTPTAVPTPTPVPLDVDKGSVSSPVARGDKATVTIRTAAGADCKIVVEYESGPSQASGLGEKTADADGAVSWTWTVGQTTKLGTWPITVTCFKAERQGTLETSFEVK
jgi:hypothetical protein